MAWSETVHINLIRNCYIIYPEESASESLTEQPNITLKSAMMLKY